VSAAAEEFIGRVLTHVATLSREKFNSTTWRFENRPTVEGVGLKPHAVTVEDVARCILDVERYPDEVRFVESTQIIDRRSETDVTYIQRMNLPVLGRVQVQINLADYGVWEDYQVIAWDQDDEGTFALDRSRGFRTEYNLGAWLLTPDSVSYALSSAPLKSDVGTLKYLALTKGADVTAGEVIRQNIEAMIGWAERS
jgi:hypothetical protein